MTEHTSDGLGLDEAIAMLRDDLLRARQAAADSEIQLPVQSMTVELKVSATRRADGKAGFKVPLVNVELGGAAGWQSDHLQTVTITFGEPVDPDGKPVKVARASHQHKR